jgi:hypothetical protein
VLARLIESGRFDRHLRRMRKIYAGQRDALFAALDEHAPDIRRTGLAASFHAVAQLAPGASETDMVEAARARSGNLWDERQPLHHPPTHPSSCSDLETFHSGQSSRASLDERGTATASVVNAPHRARAPPPAGHSAGPRAVPRVCTSRRRSRPRPQSGPLAVPASLFSRAVGGGQHNSPRQASTPSRDGKASDH